MESKDIMELIDRILLLTEENTKMTERLERLASEVVDTERAEAQYAFDSGYNYSAILTCDKINRIMGWKRDEEAERILKMSTKKEETDEG